MISALNESRLDSGFTFIFWIKPGEAGTSTHNKREAVAAPTAGCWIGSCPSVFSQLFGIKLKIDGGSTPEEGSRSPAPW